MTGSRPPDLRPESYLGEWEFSAAHHLAAADAERLTTGELVELAGEGERERLLKLALSYTPTRGNLGPAGGDRGDLRARRRRC